MLRLRNGYNLVNLLDTRLVILLLPAAVVVVHQQQMIMVVVVVVLGVCSPQPQIYYLVLSTQLL
jgi:hypothetical protein